MAVARPSFNANRSTISACSAFFPLASSSLASRLLFSPITLASWSRSSFISLTGMGGPRIPTNIDLAIPSRNAYLRRLQQNK